MQATLPDHLAVMAKGGDGWALEELIRFHTRAVDMVAHRFSKVAQSLTKDDLAQEAVMALIELLPSWKPGSGSSFATYFFTFAPHRLRRRMDATDLPIRLPAYVGLEQRRAYRETGKATMPQGVSLFKPSLDGDSELLDEVESTATQVDHVERLMGKFAVGLLDRLPPKEREVVSMVTLADVPMTEVAAAWDCTRQYVHIVHTRAIKRLQAMARSG